MLARKKKPKEAWWKKNPEVKRIARHLGKAIDRTNILDLIMYGTAAIFGGRAAYLATDNFIAIPGGAATGIIALKLASSRNIIAGASGVATLAAIGLANIINPDMMVNPIAAQSEAWKELWASGGPFK